MDRVGRGDSAPINLENAGFRKVKQIFLTLRFLKTKNQGRQFILHGRSIQKLPLGWLVSVSFVGHHCSTCAPWNILLKNASLPIPPCLYSHPLRLKSAFLRSCLSVLIDGDFVVCYLSFSTRQNVLQGHVTCHCSTGQSLY